MPFTFTRKDITKIKTPLIVCDNNNEYYANLKNVCDNLTSMLDEIQSIDIVDCISKKVICIKSPKYNFNKNVSNYQNELCLKNIYINCLNLAVANGISKIVFPLILFNNTKEELSEELLGDNKSFLLNVDDQYELLKRIASRIAITTINDFQKNLQENQELSVILSYHSHDDFIINFDTVKELKKLEYSEMFYNNFCIQNQDIEISNESIDLFVNEQNNLDSSYYKEKIKFIKNSLKEIRHKFINEIYQENKKITYPKINQMINEINLLFYNLYSKIHDNSLYCYDDIRYYEEYLIVILENFNNYPKNKLENILGIPPFDDEDLLNNEKLFNDEDLKLELLNSEINFFLNLLEELLVSFFEEKIEQENNALFEFCQEQKNLGFIIKKDTIKYNQNLVSENIEEQDKLERYFNEINKINNINRPNLYSLKLYSNYYSNFMYYVSEIANLKGLRKKDIYNNANLTSTKYKKIESITEPVNIKRLDVLAIAFSLQLEYIEFNELIKLAGYTISKTLEEDKIIKKFIIEKNYNIISLNMQLLMLDNEIQLGDK